MYNHCRILKYILLIKPDIVQNVLLEDLDVRVRSFP